MAIEAECVLWAWRGDISSSHVVSGELSKTQIMDAIKQFKSEFSLKNAPFQRKVLYLKP